jgi:poly-gamma-glutamate capsule biosynthesis protein CapA/YwtB (metallophosphatase superfamily)
MSAVVSMGNVISLLAVSHGEQEKKIGVAPALLLIALGLGACGAEAPAPGIFIEVVDENGMPVAGAEVDVGVDVAVTGKSGRARVTADLVQPAVAVIRGDGILPEPVVIEGAVVEDVVRVRVLSDGGGQRWVMHAAGDVMLGRRYESPDEGAPLLPEDDVAGGARRVVAAVARAFAAADVSTVNLESVVGDVPDEAGYPAKAFIIRSQPESLAALDEMGVDLAILANNHIRDYGDQGVLATMAALNDAGIAHVGAAAGTSDDAAAAAEPALLEVGGVRVGVLAWSTLSGSAVNDGFPQDEEPMPADVDPDVAWQYEARAWGFEGTILSVPALPRRIGSAWQLFSDAEPELGRAEVAEAWASLAAVYPELQDWVAGRGHGGAAAWQTQQAQAAIADLATRADVVMVQIHGGFDMQAAPSAFVRTVARAAVDAGADLVVAHHPHVLQGAEWYKGALIAYSLGNFLFDQEFLQTFSTAFLRTVWEGDTLVEARFVPVEIDGFQPRPVTGASALRAARALWEKNVSGVYTDRDGAGDVRTLIEETRSADVATAHVALHQYGALLTHAQPDAETIEIDAPAQSIVPIAYEGLVRVPAEEGLRVGRSLFDWGRFEDDLADGESRADTHWAIDGDGKEVVLGPAAFDGDGYLRLRRRSGGSLPSFVRPVARISLPEHRLYRAQDGAGVAVDGPATYTLRFAARLAGGGGTPFVSLELGQFDDGNPGENPASRPVGELELPVDIEANGQWQVVELEISEAMLTPGDRRANTVMVYLRLGPPERGEAYFDVDELTIIEWRPAVNEGGRFGAYDFLSTSADQRVTLEGLPLAAVP